MKENYLISTYCNKGYVYHIPSKKMIQTSQALASTLNGMLENDTLSTEARLFLDSNFSEDDSKNESFCEPLILSREIQRLEIITSTTCNLSCSYCYANGGNYGQKERTIDNTTRDAIIKFLREEIIDVKSVTFFGGEPLLASKQIKKLCCELKKLYGNNIYYTIVTNGTIFSEDFVEAANHNQFYITVSIDGPEKVHNRLRPKKNGSKDSFDIIRENIKKYSNKGVKINSIEATYTNIHVKEGISRSDLELYLRDTFKIDKVLIEDVFEPAGFQLNEEIKLPITKLKDKLKFKRKDQTKFSDMQRDYYFFKGSISNICTAGIRMFGVLPNGDVYPCHLFSGHKKYKMGNINLGNLFSQNKFHEVSKFMITNMKKYPCKSCRARVICSNCPALDLLKIKSINCDENLEQCKYSYENLIKQLKI